MKTAILLTATILLTGCVSQSPAQTGESPTGEALAARLADHTAVIRPDGGAPPGEPEAVRMTFNRDGTIVLDFVDGPARMDLGDDFPITVEIGAMTRNWRVEGNQVCVDDPGVGGECIPVRVVGDTLYIEDDGIPGRGTLVPL